MPEIYFYETDILSKLQAIKFVKVFDNQIGTECETSNINQDYFVTCFELIESETEKCRIIEGRIRVCQN